MLRFICKEINLADHVYGGAKEAVETFYTFTVASDVEDFLSHYTTHNGMVKRVVVGVELIKD